MNLKSIYSLLLALFLMSVVSANNNPKDSLTTTDNKPLRTYTTIRLSTAKPVIDGKLDDDCWKTGEWAGDFTQWIPKEGAKPSQETQFKILYDDKNLYVAIRAFDKEPKKISRKGGRRDLLIGEQAGVNFDSYHDHRTGFEFSVTAAGQKVDLILTNPMEADFNWNAVWYVKTGLEDSAWVAEYEIPLSQLRYSKDKEQVWGMHVWRWIDRLSEESDWEPQSSTSPGMLYLFGELHGIKDLPKSRRIEIMPYTLGKLKTFDKVPQNPFAKNGHSFMGNVGLDAKIGLSSNFTADLTVNPDFGQVESDPSVMNLTAFETLYEEKRPFFLEGSNIFKFELGDANLFYTRRIGHTPVYHPELETNQYIDYPDNTSILSAVKISGKSKNGLAVGILHSLTAGENAQLSTNGIKKDLRVEPLTSYTVGRVQQDFNEGTTVLGGIITSTNRFINDPYLEFQNQNAFTGGVDLLHQWNKKEFYLDAKIIGSTINGSAEAIRNLQLSSARYYQRPDVNYLHYDPTRTQLSGQGGRVKIGKGSKGLWRYSSEFNWRSPGLDLNDIGFMQMADLVSQETEVSYFVNKPVSIFRTYSVAVHQSNNWDYGLNYLYSGLFLTSKFEFLNQWMVSPSVHFRNEGYDNRVLRGGEAMRLPALWEGSLEFHTDMAKKFIISLNATREAAQNENYRNSFVQATVTTIPYNVLKLSASVNYSENMDNLQYVDTKILGTDIKYILAHLNQKTLGATFRVDYNITPEISIQYYGSPFASVGKYSKLKEVTNPRATSYSDRFKLLNTQFVNNSYQVAETNEAPAYSVNNPDFTFNQFRSNLVFRWEYRPGSQLFFVWGNERTGWKNDSNSKVGRAVSDLKDVSPTNIFLIKLSYWFSL
ncbi:hypothetical protein AQPE_2668 [Aquipluma nitroreducens]|uniref:Uncharacterized protein n=1 Tax=Aquipluma nitroreducens TaxID=2010828 RepID=A0A5K7SAL6_9BACT|nr:DUF5916 domain-containing protein [Aquipluma nitroreducens]BBE18506.1 hypothetical protein AQPE_2668 [Aquipluma nitroreducens]